jgi:hypothetical protein
MGKFGIFESKSEDYSNILTNFMVTVPAFAPRRSGTQSRLSDFVLIAKEGLYSVGGGEFGSAVIGGDIYAGDIGEAGAGIGGNLTLGGAGRSIYVADDLNLAAGADIALYGRYYGFGDSSSEAALSSAVNVNGGNVSLNMAGLSKLTLAGYSFVWGNDSAGPVADAGSGVPMANSLSVLDDQKAYFVPPEHVMSADGSRNIGNPVPITDGGDPTSNEDDIPNFSISFLPDGASVERRYTPGTPGYVYFIYRFETIAQRNAAFRKYFEDNPEAVTAYLESCFGGNIEKLTLPVEIHTRGLVWGKAGDGLPKLLPDVPAPPEPPSEGTPPPTDGITDTDIGSGWLYDAEGVPSRGRSAWDYYVVDKGPADGVQSGTFAAADGSAKSVSSASLSVANVNGTESAKIIVCDGDVRVQGSYEGLIIASGKVTLLAGASVTRPDDETLKAAFEAEVAGGGHVYDYIRYYLYGKDGEVGGGDLRALVRYTDWTKNE